jgi:hypothetical protein
MEPLEGKVRLPLMISCASILLLCIIIQAIGRLAIAVFALIAAPLLALPWQSARTRTLAAILFGSMVLIYGAAFLCDRPFPIGRVLIPFLPVLLLTSASAWSDVLVRMGPTSGLWATSIAVGVLAVNFARSYEPKDTRDWHFNKVNPQASEQAYSADGVCRFTFAVHPSEIYYRRLAARARGKACD